MTTITLTNLITNGSFESNSNWSGGAYSTDYACLGARSYKMTGTNSTAEVTAPTSNTIPLQPAHIYYACVWGYQTVKAGRSVGFYWPIAEPSMNDNLTLKDAGKWQRYSARANRASFSAGNYALRIDYNNNQAAGSIYFDGAMLIDLTAAFGAGKEPSQEWCDMHLPYIDGTLTLQVEMSTTLEVIAAQISPNPVSINAKTTISVTVAEQNRHDIYDPYYHSGEAYCGEI